jgi:3-hydroxyisobutyrate dehydrogenase-like beta-hydroxyacid dehydrogenase
MKSIGFIGLGTMGAPMAVNLLKKGYSLTIFNRTTAKAHEFINLGAEVVSSPSRVAKAVDVLFTNVSDDQALLDVFFGADGILAGIHPGLTVIDCSTVSPETSRKIAQELAVHYADFLDAPVTGSKPAAESGSLVFMVGGDQEVFTEHAELFAALGSKALYMGPSGSGSYAKLAHNTIVGINSAALSEGVALAAKAGLDPAQFLEIVQSGGANSKQAELKAPKILERDFSPQFSLKLMLKDLLLASKLSQDFKFPAPLLNAATNLFQIGLSKGYGDQDLSAIIQCYEDWIHEEVKKRPTQPSFDRKVSEAESNRRRNNRVPMNISLQLSVYQWEQEGSFSGQNIKGVLYDLSENGLQIASSFPLAKEMFIVIHFPQEADLPPITGKIIRIEPKTDEFRYGCMLSGLPPYVRIKLEEYIEVKRNEALEA